MTSLSLPDTKPPRPVPNVWQRNLPRTAPRQWLAAGFADFRWAPAGSLAYGIGLFAVSVGLIAGLVRYRVDYILLPALAGFLIVGPFLALGLYEKSRRLARGERVGILGMLTARPRSGGQILFLGLLLGLLALLWMRAAVLLYALFFGMLPFPGSASIFAQLLTTGTGWALLLVGTAVGGLFASFGFAISAVSVPMMLDRRVDALTAMGRSMALVWHNWTVMTSWGAVIVGCFALAVLTGLVGLIVLFPIVGHATWHAYRDLCPAETDAVAEEN